MQEEKFILYTFILQLSTPLAFIFLFMQLLPPLINDLMDSIVVIQIFLIVSLFFYLVFIVPYHVLQILVKKKEFVFSRRNVSIVLSSTAAFVFVSKIAIYMSFVIMDFAPSDFLVRHSIISLMQSLIVVGIIAVVIKFTRFCFSQYE